MFIKPPIVVRAPIGGVAPPRATYHAGKPYVTQASHTATI